MKVVIIGGVAGGASAAARLRRLDENVEIIMFEKGDYISFANCGLPYYIGEVIKDREKLLVQTPEAMKKRFNIDVRVNSEVIGIDVNSKNVKVKINEKSYEESYDYLVLSPGADPIIPEILTDCIENIFTVRNVNDVDNIKNIISSKNPKTAVVIGGGFIGIEMAENLAHLGIDTTIIQGSSQVMNPFDSEMASLIQEKLEDNGVKVILKEKVKKIEGNKEIVIKLSNQEIKPDIVILAIGVKPSIELAKSAGIKIGDKGGIVVDEILKTSNEYIFAVGDAIEVNDQISMDKTIIPLAGPANKQGRIVAGNILGQKSKYKSTLGTSIVKVFDLVAASTGNNEKALKSKGIDYEKSYTHSASHAGYYPGAKMMSIKLLFERKTGKILGAQIIGSEGVDKRIDVLATAIKSGLTVFDLEELELAYAPPFSSAKDPVNMAGYVASNILEGNVKIKHWDEINLNDETIILDVRSDKETNSGMINGAINISVDELRDKMSSIPKDKEILIYCKVGLRGYIAYRMLIQNGFNCYNISGGYDTYKGFEKAQNNILSELEVLSETAVDKN